MNLLRVAATAAPERDDGVETSRVRTRDTVLHLSHETSAAESSGPGRRRPVPLFSYDEGIGARPPRHQAVRVGT